MNQFFVLFKKIQLKQWTIVAFIMIILTILIISWYGYDKITTLYKQVSSLEDKLSSATALLQENITETQSSLSSALEEERENVVAIKEQLGSVQSEVGGISGTVTILEKLSKTDPEFLQKYSKVFFLNEHYFPSQLIEFPDKFEYHEYKHTQIHTKVWPYLRDMVEQAEQDSIDLFIFSGYRSFGTQEALKGQYSITYGEGANTFSADQGYSEHQLGTTVDLITTGIGGTLSDFENTKAYQWLLDNAHNYGFTLSYPETNGYYIFEPWHWRFVGINLASDLNKNGKYFYDLDQREIDEYLVSLFD